MIKVIYFLLFGLMYITSPIWITLFYIFYGIDFCINKIKKIIKK